MKDAAVNRLAKSITQLTLCQVTTSEVDAATKLLDKVCPEASRIQNMWKFGERMYSVLNHLEPTWTSLNLSWNNACACEQLGNHFKFVGTDLWTIEPIGTYRNQVGTNLEPNGTSLCMEELGDGFSFVLWFLVFLDVVWPMS